jgi:hypothetical protein
VGGGGQRQEMGTSGKRRNFFCGRGVRGGVRVEKGSLYNRGEFPVVMDLIQKCPDAKGCKEQVNFTSEPMIKRFVKGHYYIIG